MSDYLVARFTPHVAGEVLIPGSKSQSIRALFFALMAKGRSDLDNLLVSEDTECAIRVCRALGADIVREGDTVQVQSVGLPLQTEATTLHAGDSGITTRFVLPICGFLAQPHPPVVVTCGEQMRARPIASLAEALQCLGMSVEYVNDSGKLPLQISGTLIGGEATVSGITSQYLSALLVALPCAPNSSVIRVEKLHERPYVDLTLAWLQRQNIRYVHRRPTSELDEFEIVGGQHYQPFDITIPGDFSSASYFIAAACLLGTEVTLLGLDYHEPQGDKRLVSILQEMGADIDIHSDRLIIRGGRPLQGIHIDANDIPDLLPTLAVIGTRASGRTTITNVPQARIKETDRIHSMTEGLRKMGATIEEFSDGMTVYPSDLVGAEVAGFHDHRTVMALALAGLLAQGETRISHARAIEKTFPTYVHCMQSLGARLDLCNDTSC